MDWFASWFDTSYYHILYKDRNLDEAASFVQRIMTFLDLPKGSNILDLACGAGRHSIHLSQLGYRVTGLDLSENSIQKAKLHESGSLTFGVHDMREVYAPNEFDAILNLFTSFGYFDEQSDNLKVMQSVHAMLRHQGVFVIDFMNAAKVVKNLVTEEIKEINGIRFEIQRVFDGKHIHKRIEFEDQGEHYRFSERVQALSEDDFSLMLNASGFEVLNVFGGYQLEAFDVSGSERLICVARKV